MKKFVVAFSAVVLSLSFIGCSKDKDNAATAQNGSYIQMGVESPTASDSKTQWDYDNLNYLFTDGDSTWIDGVKHTIYPSRKIAPSADPSTWPLYHQSPSDRAYMILDQSLTNRTACIALYPSNSFTNGQACTYANDVAPAVLISSHQDALPAGAVTYPSSYSDIPPMVGVLRFATNGSQKDTIQYMNTMSLLCLKVTCKTGFSDRYFNGARGSLTVTKVVLHSSCQIAGNGTIAGSRTGNPYLTMSGTSADDITFDVDSTVIPINSRSNTEAAILPIRPLPANTSLTADVYVTVNRGNYVVTTRSMTVNATTFVRSQMRPVSFDFDDCVSCRAL